MERQVRGALPLNDTFYIQSALDAWNRNKRNKGREKSPPVFILDVVNVDGYCCMEIASAKALEKGMKSYMAIAESTLKGKKPEIGDKIEPEFLIDRLGKPEQKDIGSATFLILNNFKVFSQNVIYAPGWERIRAGRRHQERFLRNRAII